MCLCVCVCVCVCISCLVVSDSAIPWTVALQAPLSMGFSRQEYWSGLPFPSPNWGHRVKFKKKSLNKTGSWLFGKNQLFHRLALWTWTTCVCASLFLFFNKRSRLDQGASVFLWNRVLFNFTGAWDGDSHTRRQEKFMIGRNLCIWEHSQYWVLWSAIFLYWTWR